MDHKLRRQNNEKDGEKGTITKKIKLRTYLCGRVTLAFCASVGPIRSRQSATAFSFSKTITNTGPLIPMESQREVYKVSQSEYHRANESHHRSKLTIQSSFKIIKAQYDASCIETQPFYDESYIKIQKTLNACYLSYF